MGVEMGRIKNIRSAISRDLAELKRLLIKESKTTTTRKYDDHCNYYDDWGNRSQYTLKSIDNPSEDFRKGYKYGRLMGIAMHIDYLEDILESSNPIH